MTNEQPDDQNQKEPNRSGLRKARNVGLGCLSTLLIPVLIGLGIQAMFWSRDGGLSAHDQAVYDNSAAFLRALTPEIKTELPDFSGKGNASGAAGILSCDGVDQCLIGETDSTAMLDTQKICSEVLNFAKSLDATRQISVQEPAGVAMSVDSVKSCVKVLALKPADASTTSSQDIAFYRTSKDPRLSGLYATPFAISVYRTNFANSKVFSYGVTISSLFEIHELKPQP